MLTPQELLHVFGPYLPTDRFRAILRGAELPAQTRGAAMVVDMSGFSEMTAQLVEVHGAQRASEELKRRLNPMFEAIAGQVFQYGGSVIHFAGDGFTAWFDDAPASAPPETAAPVLGVLRALCAGREMQSLMRLWPSLRLRVCIAEGVGSRYVVGLPEHGLTDVLAGPAAHAANRLVGETTSEQVMVHSSSLALLRRENVPLEISETGNAILLNSAEAAMDALIRAARNYRWSAWQLDVEEEKVVAALRPYISSAIREQVEQGLSQFVGELRLALPMFIRFEPVVEDVNEAQTSSEYRSERELLDEYVGTVQRVLTEFGGRLVSVEVSDKGSVIFAVFGAPVTYGDDAVRAINAALKLREIAGKSDDAGIRGQRIAISRGYLYTGVIGGEARHEYSTIGDETNIAARLMVAASDGQILTTSAVRKEARRRILFQDVPPISVKGRPEPIPVSEPLSLRSRSSASRKFTRGFLVGRSAELAQIRKLLAAVEDNHPRILRIEGTAGIGKTRLLEEAARVASVGGFSTAIGVCISTGRSVPYLPWREALASLLELQMDTSSSSTIAAQLETLIRELDPQWMARLPLLGDVLQIDIPDTSLTANLEGRQRSQAVFTLVTDILVKMAQRQPLLFCLEDTQWLDEGSEALTIDLARRLMVETVPIMLIMVHRSLSDIDHPPMLLKVVTDMYLHQRLELQALTPTEVFTIIERYLNTPIPPELAHFVFSRTQGNPLFVQEVLDTLLETERIKVVNGRMQINTKLEETDLPPTVQGLIQARIDRLEEMDKLLLKVAAVIGREFQLRTLMDSLPIPLSADDILQRLHRLQVRDFLVLEERDGEQVCHFKHGITQDVTYQSLPFTQRRQLHLAVAVTLQKLTPEPVEALAYHFSRASEDRSARKYLLQAAHKAFDGFAPAAALSYFSQAYELSHTDAERAEVVSSRLEVLARNAETGALRVQIEALSRLAEQNNRDDWRALVYFYRAQLHIQTTTWSAAVEAAETAARLAEANNDDELLWTCYRLLWEGYHRLRQPDKTHALNIKISEASLRLGDERTGIEFMLMQLEDGYVDDTEDAVTIAEYALETAQAQGDLVLEARCTRLLGSLHEQSGGLMAALTAWRQEVSILRQLGDRRGEGLTLNRIGAVLISLGQFSEANSHLLDAYRLLRQMGERAGEADSLIQLGVIAEHYRAYGEALAYLNRGLVIQKSLSALDDSARTLYHMGTVHLARSEYDDALSSFIQARSVLRNVGTLGRFAEIEIALGEVALRRSDSEKAMRRLTPHLDTLEHEWVNDFIQPGMAFWRAVLILEAANETAQADKLRRVFQQRVDRVSGSLQDTLWRKAYRSGIWYHAALLDRTITAAASRDGTGPLTLPTDAP
ncbi:MAG: AAA family ATPase [Anaerolineae bacterium]|nr:AAA family ATPase [Anaerolineae bacterium]